MPFPFYTKEQLKELCPSKGAGRTWPQELGYRNECIELLGRTCDALKCGTVKAKGDPQTEPLPLCVKEKAVVLLHRFLTCVSSTQWQAMRKWALAAACVLAATKIDPRSLWVGIDQLVVVGMQALRALQGRPMEREFYGPDGVSPSASYVAAKAQLVREAEMELYVTINFELNDVSAPSTVAVHQLNELGLSEAAEAQYPDLAPKISAVRTEAVVAALQCVLKPSSVVVLLHPVEHLVLASISRACRTHRLQWYLKPAPEGQLPLGVKSLVPNLTTEQLKAIERVLPAMERRRASSGGGGGGGSSGGGPAVPSDANDGVGCFRSRGGTWTAGRPRRSALSGSGGDGSTSSGGRTGGSGGGSPAGPAGGGGSALHQQALGGRPESAPSPDSVSTRLAEDAPATAAAAAAAGEGAPAAPPAAVAAGGGAGGSGSSGSRGPSRHVRFGELPPSVLPLQLEFRRLREAKEAHERATQAHQDMLAEERTLQQQQEEADEQALFEDEGQQQQQQEGLVGGAGTGAQPAGLQDMQGLEGPAAGAKRRRAQDEEAWEEDAGVKRNRQQQEGEQQEELEEGELCIEVGCAGQREQPLKQQQRLAVPPAAATAGHSGGSAKSSGHQFDAYWRRGPQQQQQKKQQLVVDEDQEDSAVSKFRRVALPPAPVQQPSAVGGCKLAIMA